MNAYPQMRDNMSTRTRELWRCEGTMDFAMTEMACRKVPPHWDTEWRVLWSMPFGTYETPFPLTSTVYSP